MNFSKGYCFNQTKIWAVLRKTAGTFEQNIIKHNELLGEIVCSVEKVSVPAVSLICVINYDW